MTRQLPTLPHTYACSTIGSTGLNFSVRNGKRCDPCDSVTEHEHFDITTYLSSLIRVLCLFVCFYTPSHKEAHVTCRDWFSSMSFPCFDTKQGKKRTSKGCLWHCLSYFYDLFPLLLNGKEQCRQAVWTISTALLNILLCFDIRPINQIIFLGPYCDTSSWGRFRAWDAFSAYPYRTWLLCNATGVTTDTPSVRSFRSSRTKNEPPQVSCARIG